MRLWSLHPKYLDSKGLVAVWRESLLAKSVLEGKTKGYTKHPQLIRFKNHPFPLVAINNYLLHVIGEAKSRGYNFNQKKIDVFDRQIEPIEVNLGQVQYEFTHLKNKLKTRNLDIYTKLMLVKQIEPHPVFKIKEGGVEKWEKI